MYFLEFILLYNVSTIKNVAFLCRNNYVSNNHDFWQNNLSAVITLLFSSFPNPTVT